MNQTNTRYAFLGVGNMAGAIIGGICSEAGGVSPSDVALFDKDRDKYIPYQNRPFFFAASAPEAVAFASVIVLAVKPQNYGELLTELKEAGVRVDGKIFVSLAAGIDTDTIGRLLGGNAHIVRTMPNTPMLIGQGLTALCRNPLVSDEEYEIVTSLFRTRGDVVSLPEEEMNKIISVTSSSPAYFYTFFKAMRDGATAQGMDGNALVSAICSVAIGSAMMAMQSGKSLEELTAMVTSRKGTTERALDVFAERGLDRIVRDAMIACTRRADELGEELKKNL